MASVVEDRCCKGLVMKLGAWEMSFMDQGPCLLDTYSVPISLKILC